MIRQQADVNDNFVWIIQVESLFYHLWKSKEASESKIDKAIREATLFWIQPDMFV